MKHTCSAPPRVVLVASCVCLWLWSVASAVGTRTGAMSCCILAVYTSYKQYITVWTREWPPVRVSCAILKNRQTSANLGLDPAQSSDTHLQREQTHYARPPCSRLYGIWLMGRWLDQTLKLRARSAFFHGRRARNSRVQVTKLHLTRLELNLPPCAAPLRDHASSPHDYINPSRVCFQSADSGVLHAPRTTCTPTTHAHTRCDERAPVHPSSIAQP